MGALLILLIQGLSLAQTRTGALTGRVLSMEGAPVAEIRVAAIDVSEATDGRLLARASIMSIAQTDSAGRYRLENIVPGAYYIVADPFESPSYYPGAPALSGGAVITIAAGATIVARDFTLVRSSGIIRTLRTQAQGREGRYTGAITTAWGAPLPNVTIILFHAESDTRFMTVTNEAGAFEFSGLPGGAFSLEVLSAVPSGAAAQGFEQLKASITIEPGQSLRQDIALRMVVGNNNGPPGRPGPPPPTPTRRGCCSPR